MYLTAPHVHVYCQNLRTAVTNTPHTLNNVIHTAIAHPHKWLFYINRKVEFPMGRCASGARPVFSAYYSAFLFFFVTVGQARLLAMVDGRYLPRYGPSTDRMAWVLVPAHWSIARSRAICVVIQVWSQVQYGGSLASDSCFHSHHTCTGAVSASEQERADVDTGIACRHPHLRSRATAICLWPYDTCSDSSDTRPAAAARAYGLFPHAVHLFFSSRQSISAVFPHRYHHLALHTPRLVPRRPPRPP
ncbi:hypothetical protein K439DRAFT_718823 [Ramaria rubella]|nr:hypothetical protein K439DRAFT_718823 [Ramaria rubella]